MSRRKLQEQTGIHGSVWRAEQEAGVNLADAETVDDVKARRRELDVQRIERMKAQRGGDIKVAVAVMYRMHAPKKREPVHRKMLQPDGEIENDKGHQGFGPKGPI